MNNSPTDRKALLTLADSRDQWQLLKASYEISSVDLFTDRLCGYDETELAGMLIAALAEVTS